MEQPNAALQRFHSTVCPETQIDSRDCFYRLLEELNKSKGSEKNDMERNTKTK